MRMTRMPAGPMIRRAVRAFLAAALVVTMVPFMGLDAASADAVDSSSSASPAQPPVSAPAGDDASAVSGAADEGAERDADASEPDGADASTEGSEDAPEGLAEDGGELLSLAETLTEAPSDAIPANAEFASDEVMIVYEDEAIELHEELPELAQVKESTIADLGIVEQEVIVSDLVSEGEVAVAKIADGETVEDVIDKVSSLEGVAYAEPNYTFALDTTYTNDPYFSNQYYLQASCFINAWDQVRTEKKVQVAVLDSGVRMDHQDLRNQVNTALAYDVLNSRALTSSNVANGGDSYGHGTMVAGVLAATANNGIGIAGASYNAEIIPVRVFEGKESNLSNIVTGLQYVVNLIQTGRARNLKVVNMSFGSTSADSATMHSIINTLYYNYGVMCVCAAGNEGSTASYYPSDYNECFSVTAISQNGTDCSWSNYNAAKDISAPGEYIYTTSNTSTSAIARTEGTSFSAPLVSAACALMYAEVPNVTPPTIMQAIKESAIKIPGQRPANGSAGALNTTAALALLTGKNLVDPSAISVTATRATNGQSYTIVASGSTLPSAAAVQFPVWSDVNGQDDIRWYSATRNSRGDWTVTVPLVNHKSHGGYTVHAYATFLGRQMFVGAASFNVAAPVTSIRGSANQSNGSITYTVTVSSSIGISRVQLPVWCSSTGGQDDIRWYDLGSPTVSGSTYSYTKTIYLSDHKYQSGAFDAHLYVTDGIGVVAPVKALRLTGVKLPPITASSTAMSAGSIYVITMSGGYLPQASRVQVPTWSLSGGQDDIVWYDATRQYDGSYVARVYISNHRTAGEYAVHVYATFGSDMAKLGETSFVVAGPSTTISALPNQSGGSIAYTVTATSSYGISSMQVAVWCSSTGGQDDIRWYALSPYRVVGNTYYFSKVVYLSDHKYQTGTYTAHVYAYDNRGILAPVSQSVQSGITLPPITMNCAKSSDGLTYTVTARGSFLTQASRVQIPTWSAKGGQDDIVWYDAARQYDGSYVARVNIRNHRTAGEYPVHVYATLGGNTVFMGSTSFMVDGPTSTISSSYDPSTGRIAYTVTVTSTRGVSNAQLPTWCSSVGGQDDINWYQLGAPQVSGSRYTYSLNVSMANHKAQSGTYIAHAYITDAAGILGTVATSSVSNVKVPSSAVSATKGMLAQLFPTYTVTIKDGIAAGASSVLVPVWSQTNGQDDIIWYPATRSADGSWSVTVDTAKHKHLGTFIAHVYGTFGGNQVMLGSVMFS